MVPLGGDPLAGIMADHLSEFLSRRMEIRLPVEMLPLDELRRGIDKAIVLLDSGGGDSAVEGSYTLSIEGQRVVVWGRDAAGVRDGVVRLVDTMGTRQAPILPLGEQVCKPRLAVRLGLG